MRHLATLALLLCATAASADTYSAIEEITPASGPIEGGTVITLRGKNLARPSGLSVCTVNACEPSVTIAGKFAQLVDVAPDGTQLRVKTPPNAGGTYDVTVAFRVKTTFQGQTLLSAPLDGTTLQRAFTYGRGGYERVLVPVFAKGETPGAFGARWVTELVGWNPSFSSVGVYQVPPETDPLPFTDPEWGKGMSSFRPQLDGPGAAFLYVHGTAPIAFSLRVRDLARQSESWGTEIPVVPESQSIAGKAILLNNIPRDADSRIMLRIYDFDGPTGGQVDVNIYFGDAHLDETFAFDTLDLPGSALQEFPSYPGYVQVDITHELDLLGIGFPFVQNAKSLRISVQAHDSAKRLWAFVAVTNNRTQQITTVLPRWGVSVRSPERPRAASRPGSWRQAARRPRRDCRS